VLRNSRIRGCAVGAFEKGRLDFESKHGGENVKILAVENEDGGAVPRSSDGMEDVGYVGPPGLVLAVREIVSSGPFLVVFRLFRKPRSSGRPLAPACKGAKRRA
jgi:hypothetical protein